MFYTTQKELVICGRVAAKMVQRNHSTFACLVVWIARQCETVVIIAVIKSNVRYLMTIAKFNRSLLLLHLQQQRLSLLKKKDWILKDLFQETKLYAKFCIRIAQQQILLSPACNGITIAFLPLQQPQRQLLKVVFLKRQNHALNYMIIASIKFLCHTTTVFNAIIFA